MDEIKEKIKAYGDAENIYHILNTCNINLSFGGYTCDRETIKEIMDDESRELLSSILDGTNDPFCPSYANIMFEDGLAVCIDSYGERLLNLLEKAIQLSYFTRESEFDEFGDPIF